MADVIRLKPKGDRAQFTILRHETARHLMDAASILLDDATNLLFAGPRAEWAEEAPVGAVANVSIEDIAQSGDARLAAMADLYARTQEVIALLRAKPQ